MSEPRVTVIHNRRKDGRGTIEAKVYFPYVRKQVYIATGQKVEEKFFDKDIAMISPDVKNYQTIKTAIKLVVHEIKEVLVSLDHGEPISPQQFQYAYKKSKNNAVESSQGDFIKFYKKELGVSSELSTGTHTSYQKTLDLLKEYKTTIPFDTLNYEFAVGFDRFLRTRYKNLNTIRKHNIIARRFVSIANKLNHVSFDTFSSFCLFSPKGQQVNKNYLTADEISLIEDLDYSSESKSMEDTRQMFLLAYYTGLRISDIIQLDDSHIHEIDGEMYIIKVIHKLRKYNREIKLNLSKLFGGKGAKIVGFYQKYGSEGLLFDDYTTSGLNYYLKKIIKDTVIKKDVSFHTARHSSLTAIAVESGSVFTVMVHGGLTSIKTAEKYIHLSEEMTQ